MNKKEIDCMELAMEIAEFCIVTGVHAQTFQEAYVKIVDIEYQNFPNSVFGIMLTKMQAFNLNNQLTQKHIDCQNNNIDSFIYMANAYLSRYASLGIMLEGSIDEKHGITQEGLDHSIGILFSGAQQFTFHNKDFQNMVVAASYSLIEKADSRINLEGFRIYAMCALERIDEINFPHESRKFIKWEAILDFFDSISESSEVTPSMINNFIYDKQEPRV